MDKEQTITQALKDLEDGRFPSIRACARAYALDHTLLVRRRRGQQDRVASHSNQQNLSPLQESLLATYLIQAEKAGHAFNHVQLRDLASLIMKTGGNKKKLGEHWVKSFLRRHPQVHTKRGITIASQRVHDLYSSKVLQWYIVLLSLFRRYQFKIANTYNMDETGCALGPCTNQTIIGTSETKRSYVSRPEDREWVSVIECIGANGRALQPVVIFKGKTVQQQWFIPDRTPNWQYTASPNAYTSNELGVRWLEEVFIPQTAEGLRATDWRLLLLDGHRSHHSLDFMWKCYQNRIIPYYLIAHASHILQPLDLCVFSSLKSTYRAAINYHSELDDTAPIKKQRFLEHYQTAREKAITTNNILSGFKAAGIVPFNPAKVLSSPFIIQVPGDSDHQRVKTPPPSTLPQEVPSTPANHRELSKAIRSVDKLTPLDRPVRNLLTKTGRTIDRLQYRLAETQRQLTIYQRTVKDHTAKAKKSGPVDLNQTFTTVEQIKKAYNEAQTATTATTRTRATVRSSTAASAASLAPTDPFGIIAERLRAITRP